jgi:hypothetical protein
MIKEETNRNFATFELMRYERLSEMISLKAEKRPNLEEKVNKTKYTATNIRLKEVNIKVIVQMGKPLF